MKIRLDGWAWAEKKEFTSEQLDSLRTHLTVILRTEGDEGPKEIALYRELPDWFAVPREYYLPKRKEHHVIEDCTVSGNMAGWPGRLRFNPARRLKPEQAEAVDMTKRYFALGPRGGIVRAAPGWGKSVIKSTTYVDGETGCRVSIADGEGGTPLVPSLDGNRITHARASQVWCCGRKLCYRLTLASGQWLEASLDHPVLAPTGFRELRDLKIGDLVAVARSVPSPEGALVVSDAEVLVCAALLTDGATKYSHVTYCKGRVELVDMVRSAAVAVPGFDGIGRDVFEHGAYYITLKGLLPWVRDLDLACGSKDKRVPATYFGLRDAQLALFLRWVFADGNVYTGTPRKIELCLSSEPFIDDVQYLLRRFGIVARKSFKAKSIKNKKDGSKKTYAAWRLQIADAPSQLAFLERIGPVMGSEEACALLEKQARSITPNTNWDVVPIGVDELREIRVSDKTGVWRRIGGLNRGSLMGRDRFQRLCEESNYTGPHRRFADMDVVWERVRSISSIGEQDVYDLTVPETHNAVVNTGIIIHNTVYSCAVIAEMNVPTLVLVHKEFLKNQWRERLEEYLPGVQIGVVQGDQCEYEGKHVVLGMIQSLSSRQYDRTFYQHFGLLIGDEIHRVSAFSWNSVPGLFPAKHRLGISATLRRKDGAENVFRYHIGQEIFAAKQESLAFKARFLYSDFYLVKSTSYNGTVGRKIVIDYLTQNETRNRLIAHDMAKALTVGRKMLVVSERLAHLKLLDTALRETLTEMKMQVPSIGYFVGGKTEDQLDKASACSVIFATTQLVLEGLDIPALDTLFLTTPLTDIEQGVGRIRRPFEGKKPPVVVDVRDDRVPMCRGSAQSRLAYYTKMNALDNRV